MTGYIAGMFLCASVAWLFYWVIVRPWLLISVEDELDRMRTALDWMTIEGDVGTQTAGAAVLKRRLENPRSVRLISLSMPLYFWQTRRGEILASVEEERATVATSPAWVKDMLARQSRLTVKACVANSPSWWPVLAALMLFSLFSRKLETWLDAFQNGMVRIAVQTIATA